MKHRTAIFTILFLSIAGATHAQKEEKRTPPTLAQDVQRAPACPSDMIEVQGEYCPNVEEVCLYYVDSKGNKIQSPPIGKTGRCGEYRNPTRCLSLNKQHIHFCIDKFEFPNKINEVPQDWMSWFDAKKAVESIGKRLCTNKEWTMAAEGVNLHPLPYGNGYQRDEGVCNFDNSVGTIDVFEATSPNSNTSSQLRSLLVPSGSRPACVSDYGVYDMAGNIDEWVVNESGKPYLSGLKGGHVFGVRNASRPMTEAHGPAFSWYETGTRGCADPLL